MAHELSEDRFGYQFIERQAPERAWHLLGEVFPQDLKITASQAAEKVRALYNVYKKQIFVQDFTGSHMPIEGLFGIFREPLAGEQTEQFFGTCGKDYEIVSVKQLLPYIDPITEKWGVETAGVMRKGKYFFLVCKTGDAQISKQGKLLEGEDLAQYVMMLVPYEPGKSIMVVNTPVRVVCMNTCIMALENNQFSIPVYHNDKAEDRFKLVMEFMGKLQVAQEKSLEALNLLASTEMKQGDLDKILYAAYPSPSKPKILKANEVLGNVELGEELTEILDLNTQHTYFTDRQAKMRMLAHTAYDRICDTHSDIAGTYYAAYNAITERENHRRGKGEQGAAESILLGGESRNKIMQDGFTACYSLASGKSNIPLKQMKTYNAN